MKAIVREWLRFAKNDLTAADLLLAESHLTAVVSFHAQQCVEKCLKALIDSRGFNPPKSHDLIRLYGIVEPWIDFDEDMLARLNQIYIDSRYPPGQEWLPDGEPTSEETKNLLEFAHSVYHMLLTKNEPHY